MTPRISKKLARRLALRAQLLHDGPRTPGGREGVARVIEHLGYVQIDTISVIERAHHHTLWTRRLDYDPHMLHDLQVRDRRIFEYWSFAASYLPMRDYRFYLPRMQNLENPRSKWIRTMLEKHGHLMEVVLERIRSEGPLGSKDFKPPPGTRRGPWWDWKPAKVALELLFWRGDVMVAERRNFQKIYDLPERVLPAGIDTRMPDQNELGHFLVRRALQAHGMASEREIRLFLQPATIRDSHRQVAGKDLLTRALEQLVEHGAVVRLQIDGRGSDDYILASQLERISRLRRSAARVHLLSPFDSLIIQRQRTQRLFGFDYALECYVPPAKRKFGYFALPILWGEDFVGKLDPKVDRKKKSLILRRLALQQDFEAGDDFLDAFAQKLADFARFNRCEQVKFERVSPGGLRGTLRQLVKKNMAS